MKKEKITLSFGGKKIPIEAHSVGLVGRAVGLMFSRRENAEILLFKFKKPTRIAIHSFFVFYPFLALWIGSDGKITEKKIVRPFTPYVCPEKGFVSLVEIPLNRKYRKILDGIERFK